MKKSVTLILAIIILVLLAATLIFTKHKQTAAEEIAPNPSTENPKSESISELHISGTEFETMDIMISPKQNGIVTNYTLTADNLNAVSVNINSFSNLVNALPNVKVEDVLADHVTDLSSYGLDNPRLHLVIHFYDPNAEANITSDGSPTTTSTFDFIWGNTLEDGKIAFMKTGEPIVYAMDGSFFSQLKEIAHPFTMVSKYIAIPNIQDVKTIDITFPDATYQVSIDDAQATYTLNGKTIDVDSFKPLYRSIIGIYGELLLDEVNTDTTPEITITYTFHDDSTTVVDFTNAVSNEYYQTSLHNSMIVGCSKSQLNHLKATLDAALSAN